MESTKSSNSTSTSSSSNSNDIISQINSIVNEIKPNEAINKISYGKINNTLLKLYINY